MVLTAEDVAGNVSVASFLNVFIDTQGPQITKVAITGDPAFNLFGIKPDNAAQGPTPPVNSLTISVRDSPGRDTTFFPNYFAGRRWWQPRRATTCWWATPAGSFPSSRSSSSTIRWSTTNRPPPPFNSCLPSHCRMIVSRSPLGRLGRSGRQQAGRKVKRSSRTASRCSPAGQRAGRRFIARFTVDSRPEIGVTAATRIYLDTTGTGSTTRGQRR